MTKTHTFRSPKLTTLDDVVRVIFLYQSYSLRRSCTIETRAPAGHPQRYERAMV